MSRKDSKLQHENMAAREKGLVVAREFDRVVDTFNKVLEYKESSAESRETDLQGLAKNLQENLDDQQTLNRNFEIYDNNYEKIIQNLKNLKSEKTAHMRRYDGLLKSIGIEGENLELENSPAPEAIPANDVEDDNDSLEKLKTRRENFFGNINQEFKNLEDKLGSIESLINELQESCNEIRQKKAQDLKKKESLEEQGEKLLNEVGRLERELEATTIEEKKLIEEFIKMLKQVEGSLELDGNTDHALFSSLTSAESAETS